MPGESPAKGFTRVLKLPPPSAVADPATWLGVSQYRVVCSFGLNCPPVTLMTVAGGPAVTSRERNALTGVGVGQGELAEQSARAVVRVRGETTVKAEARAAAPKTTTNG